MKGKKYKIGQVVQILKKEYPDISASTLRYWEREKLISPSAKTAGGQRLYTEEDVNLIRFVKEMSVSEFSVAKMQQEVCRAKTVMSKKEDGEATYAFYESEDFFRRMQVQRRRNLVNSKRDTYYRTPRKVRHRPVYSQKALQEMLDFERAKEFIDKADRFRLTCPTENEKGQKLYSLTDELILQTIVLVSLHEQYVGLESSFLDRLQGLSKVVRYLASEVGILVGFPDNPQSTTHITVYCALLYNLIQQRQDYRGEWKENTKNREDQKS